MSRSETTEAPARAGRWRCTVQPVGHGDAHRGGGVVGHRILRIPERAVAEQKRRLRRPPSARPAPVVGANVDDVDVEVLRRHAALVGHDEREVGVLRQHPRQVDEDVFWPRTRRCSSRPYSTLVTPVTVSASASRRITFDSDVERTRMARRARPWMRLLLGVDRGVDVVVEHVVVAQRVVAVEAPARGELGHRRVQRDRAPILPAEQAHVLGLRRRARDRSACRSGACRPRPGSRRAGGSRCHVSRLRSCRSTLNDLGDSRPKISCARRARRSCGAPAVRLAVRHSLLVVGRAQADEGVFERRRQRLAAGEEPHLPALGGRRRREPHLAAADEHQPGDAFVALDEKDGPLLQRR